MKNEPCMDCWQTFAFMSILYNIISLLLMVCLYLYWWNAIDKTLATLAVAVFLFLWGDVTTDRNNPTCVASQKEVTLSKVVYKEWALHELLTNIWIYVSMFKSHEISLSIPDAKIFFILAKCCLKNLQCLQWHFLLTWGDVTTNRNT